MACECPQHRLPRGEEEDPQMVLFHGQPERMPSTKGQPPRRLLQGVEEEGNGELENQVHREPQMAQFPQQPKRMPSATGQPPRRLPQGEEEEDEEDEEGETQVHHRPKMTQFHERPKRMPSSRTSTDTSYKRKPPKKKKAKACICVIITIILVLIGLTSIILWLIYYPKKPHFTVVAAAIYTLNSTIGTLPPPFITTSMQFTIVTRNPNRRTSIYYDHLSATVYYHNQAITLPLPLPPLHHETKCTVVMSPVLGGVAVPVAMDVATGLMGDMECGIIGLRLMFVGRVRYKAGVFRSVHYGAIIKCDVLIGTKKRRFGQVPLIGNPSCKVDI